jgi:hypothetical protein
LVSQEARRELEEALVHVLGAEASLEVALTVAKYWLGRLIVTELYCHFALIKVSIITFLSSM